LGGRIKGLDEVEVGNIHWMAGILFLLEFIFSRTANGQYYPPKA